MCAILVWAESKLIKIIYFNKLSHMQDTCAYWTQQQHNLPIENIQNKNLFAIVII